jgi:hypothetical protein
MQITLSKGQYQNLVRLVYLGNWMINAIRSGNKGDEQIEKYNEAEQIIFSFAKETRLERWIEYDEESKEFFPTRRFDEDKEIDEYRDEYNDHTFWEELFYRLVDRDMIDTYGEETVEKMSFEEQIEKEEPFRRKYDKEFEKYGIARLKIH